MTYLGQQPAPVRVTPRPRSDPASAGTDLNDLDREAALIRLFDLHYTALLRLAVLLGADDAENVVAEAYCQLYRRWQRLRSAEAALAYLRSVVCNLTRMRLRHLQVIRRHTEPIDDSVASAESVALLQDDHRVLIEALRRLPDRQREALVLRHWLGLRESDIAAAMGISVGAVKSHTARGIAKLAQLMEARR
ncbi:SigE family RNA polymerase sigma factor [Micromonospora sp. NPDC047548]|uniref:SigE family RNA polymerase sigma factor n=1 Tax=Micromonospora sp. NPDC047548 TaxID=3155624 RepID=UPI00340D28ED